MKFETKVKSLLYGMEFSHGIRRALMSSLGIIYFLSFGFNVVSVTSMFAFSTLIMTFFEFPTGAIADYDSRKKSMMISYFLMSVAFFGLFFFRSFWLLSASWILCDVAWTFFSGSGSAWSIDALNIAKEKSKIISLFSKSYFFEKGGYVIGGLIGLVVIAINFSLIWLAVSISHMFMFFVVWIYMEERNFNPEKVPHNYLMKSIIKAKESISYIFHRKNKQLRVLLAGAFVGTISASIFYVGMPLLFVQTLGIKPEQLSGIISLVAALIIFGPLLAEKIIHKKGLGNSMTVFILLAGILMIFFGLSSSVIIAVVFLFFVKLAFAIINVVEDSAFHGEFDSKIRASLGSINNIVWAVGSSIATFFAGISIQFFGVVNTLVISGCFALLEGTIYLFGLKKD